MLRKTVKTIPVALVASGIMLASPAFEAKASDAFMGTIQAFGFNFPPRGWALCNGQLLQISLYTALYSLLGTSFGGDARTTFGLPDLRGRVAIGFGQGPGLSNHPIGQKGGAEAVTLSVSQLAAHSHVATVKATTTSGDTGNPTGATWATEGRTDVYRNVAPTAVMHAGNVVNANSGGGQSFWIMQPYLPINYSCALQGIYPSRD